MWMCMLAQVAKDHRIHSACAGTAKGSAQPSPSPKGVPDPPNSPLGSQHGDMESQFGAQHGSGASNPDEELMDDKMLKV
eukprot:3423439-Karenia_brevis.AAC.1